MGDVAILSPVLDALLKQNPDIKVTILTQKFFTPIFKNFDNVSVFPVETKGKHKGFLGLWKLYKELKKHHFYAIADIHNVLRSNILKTFFLGKKCVQIDKGRSEKKDLISKKSFKQLKTSHERYADVFRKLGFKINLSSNNFQKKEDFPDKIKEIVNLSEHKKILGIAPFAAHKSKMYSLHKMETVINTLSKNYTILLFGGKNDKDQLEKFQTNKNIFSIAGKLTFSEELNTISNLNGMLSMDSGNAHLAAMYGVKVISIWGVTHPFAGFAPFLQPKENSLIADTKQFPLIPTSIYGNKYPEEYLNAADSITPEAIITKIMQSI